MPANIAAPGVFVEEVPRDLRAIEPVSTGVTAFLGAARKGASYRAFEIRSPGEFLARFGTPKADLELGYAISQYFLNGARSAWVVRVPKTPTAAQWQRGLDALARVERFDLLVLPGVEGSDVYARALACAQVRRAFLLLDAPRSATSAELMRAAAGSLPVTADAAVYFPWVDVADSSGVVRRCAPGGSVAGVIARTDATRGILKAPAGADATVHGTCGLAVFLKDAEAGSLNSMAVNCLREFPLIGRTVFGARTRAGADANASDWKYIPVRRFALYLETCLERGLAWTVFEPNAEPLWAQIRLSVGDFLRQIFRQGAFQGTTPAQAFFVQCDGNTVTAADLATGRVNVCVGFAPLKPAEFVVLKLRLRAQSA